MHVAKDLGKPCRVLQEMTSYFASPLIGGCTLGLLAAGRLLLQGEVLGISGHLRYNIQLKTRSEIACLITCK